MARRTLQEEHVRKITKLGRATLAVTIPAAIARAMKLKERQKVVVRRQGSAIVIRDWEK